MLGREVEVHRPSVAPGQRARATGAPSAADASRPVLAFADGPGPSADASRRGLVLRARRRSPSTSGALRRDLLAPPPARRPVARPTSSPTALGASRTGVLQQLRALEAAHLVSRQTVRHGVGRPRHLYDVTPDAQELFPSNYDGLAAGLLAAIDAVGGDDLLEQVFAGPPAPARRPGPAPARRTGRAGRAAGRAGPRAGRRSRTSRATSPRRSSSTDGTIRLREHNCAIFDVAQGTPAACDAELELSATSSAPTSSARRTSPRATAAARTGSRRRTEAAGPDPSHRLRPVDHLPRSLDRRSAPELDRRSEC